MNNSGWNSTPNLVSSNVIKKVLKAQNKLHNEDIIISGEIILISSILIVCFLGYRYYSKKKKRKT